MCYFFKRCRKKTPTLHTTCNNIITISYGSIDITTEIIDKAGDDITALKSHYDYSITTSDIAKIEITTSESRIRDGKTGTFISEPPRIRIS